VGFVISVKKGNVLSGHETVKNETMTMTHRYFGKQTGMGCDGWLWLCGVWAQIKKGTDGFNLS